MSNSYGNALKVTLFGESHGPEIGIVIDGLVAGTKISEERIKEKLSLRRPSGNISTPRSEADEFRIVSGVFEGKATGSPITILIPNKDTRSKDYSAARYIPRPSHADYTAFIKYGGNEDYRGGGHFSGRITAALVAAGAVISGALEEKGIKIGTHIKSIYGICDREFSEYNKDIDLLNSMLFPVLDEKMGEEMTKAILKAREESDSVGGVLETAITGLPVGLGEPWFDTVESCLSHILFSVPAVKGVEFGDGFELANKKGSEVNDAFTYKDGTVSTETNHMGGILGGITNGMPVIFRCALKPTPTIGKEQKTVDIKSGEDITHAFVGRHDPCIVHRARAVIDAASAIAVYDLILRRKAGEI